VDSALLLDDENVREVEIEPKLVGSGPIVQRFDTCRMREQFEDATPTRKGYRGRGQ
jgi:hypothetical protein